MPEVYAEDVNYWKTSTTQYDTWVKRIREQLESIGGQITGEISGMINGKSGIAIDFVADGEAYRIMLPILPSRTGDDVSAKRQAITAIFYAVKARVVEAKFWGVRGAFSSYLMLPDGRTTNQLTAPEILSNLPNRILLPSKIDQ